MGKKDLWQSDYFDDKKRFADMFNGTLFKGEQIMNAEELEDEETVRAILGMLDVKIDINKYKKKTMEGVRYHMCKAWDDHKESGRREEQKEGLISLVNILATIFSDFDTIYNKIISDKKYQNVTREQVEKYYYSR